MIALLLRLYPARWRARYGDEFQALLSERPLGPFDVADVLLGALDAHLHLRGLGAASEHAKGFAMSLRIGGYAAILGGILWLVALVGNAINNGADSGSSVFGTALVTSIVLATAATLVALVGLSAFQSRRHPVLTWTAFVLPAIGAVLGLLGVVAMAVAGDTDSSFIGGLSAWAISTIGVTALVLGSALFAVATWLSGSLSRVASALLFVGALLFVPAIGGVTGGLLPPVLGYLVLVAAILAFPAGWVTLGVSALRVGRGPVASMGRRPLDPDPRLTSNVRRGQNRSMALRERTRYVLDVTYAQVDVIKTLVDFSDRRPLIWRETSHPAVYRLHSLTATGADVTEGAPVSWSRERYDWSEPGLVRLRQLESNMATPGGIITYRITPTPGGCHIECDRRRTFIGLRGHLLGWLMVVFGARILRAQLRTGLDRALDSER